LESKLLLNVSLTNFQRHRHLSVTFNGGLTALRGANEAGKSTLLRGICYVLFGVKVLGIPLEDLVTWGEEVKTLKGTVDLQVDGVVYSFKRGKSGAEVNYDGGRVTGQNEVTDFACRLLRCADGVAATRLILANQNEIRGALAAGPAKTTELIERLAEFDQIDHLLDLMDEKLTHGATGTVEAAIATAEAQLQAARDAAVAPDLPMLDHRIEEAQEIVQRNAQVVEAAQVLVDSAREALAAGKLASAEHAALNREISQLDTRIGEVEGELEDLRRVSAPDNVDIPALRQRIADAENMDAIRAKYAKVEPHTSDRGPLTGENTFRGTLEHLEAAIRARRAEHQAQERAAEAARAEARVLRQRISDGSCSFCGKDVSDVPEVKAKNDSLEMEAVRHDQTAEFSERACATGRAEVARLEGILSASKPSLRVLDVVGDCAELVDDLLPPRLRWTGEIVKGVVDVAGLREQIAAAERQQRAFERASAKIETLDAERTRLYQQREDAYGRRARGPKIVDLGALQAAVEDARDQQRPVQERAQQAQAALQAAERAKVDAVAAYERAKTAVEAAKAALKQRRAELEELGFNNALIKRVRQCRPMIADQLWNLVLSAVSTYFSEMRGVKSRVRKNGDGFTVDGHPVTTLSGSTLDVLGLAIRVALVRTFLPAAPFLILDEPAAACDDARTNNMLGFLAGAGFKQVILVTHEDISQAVADNMITL
jgi:DNA repair exonuclease SbcCD ATPase subunit